MTHSSERTSPEAIQKLKEEAAHSAAAMIEDGMIVGLGSGSTAKLVVDAIGKRVKDGLRLVGIPTSEKTAAQAKELNIPLATLAQHPRIHLALDGADEVEVSTLNLIKGGGGNLLREKLVAIASERFVIVVDERKLVDKLGASFSLPVEVVPFGWQSTEQRLKELRANPQLRLGPNGEVYITDGGHYILDCAFGPIASPSTLAQSLDATVGVVEHGLFIGMTSAVVVGQPEGIKLLNAVSPA